MPHGEIMFGRKANHLFAALGLIGVVATAITPTKTAAFEEIDRYAFVISKKSNEITAIDTRNDVVVARLELLEIPNQIFIVEDIGLLVAATGASATVEILDLRARRSLEPITLGHAADLMQYHADADLLAVMGGAEGSLTLVGLRHRTVLARLDGLGRPTGIIFGPEGKRLFVAHADTSSITIIDANTGNVVDRLHLLASDSGERRLEPPGIANLARTPSGEFGFAVPKAPDQPIAMFDLSAPKVLHRLSRGAGPSRSFNTADGAYLIVPNNGDGTVSVHAISSKSEVARIPATQNMLSVSTGWFDTTAFISRTDESSVLVVDLLNKHLAGSIPLPGRPGFGATTADGIKIYIPLTDIDKVGVIDTRERAVIKLIDNVGAEPWRVQIASPLAYCH